MKFYNDDGDIIIDETLRNWICHPTEGSLSVTMPSPLWGDGYDYTGVNTGPYVYRGTYFLDNPAPVGIYSPSAAEFGIKLSATYWYNISCHYDWYDNNWGGGTTLIRKVGITGMPGTSFSIPYAIIYNTVAVTDEGYFRLYWKDPESSGGTACYYNSNLLMPQIAGFYNVATPITGNPAFSDVDVTVSDAVNNYFQLRTNAWARHQTGDPDWRRWYNIQMMRTSSTNVRIRAANYYSEWNDQGGSNTHENYSPPYLNLIEYKIPGIS